MKATVLQTQRAQDGAPVHYERHRPEQTTLYRLVQQTPRPSLPRPKTAWRHGTTHLVMSPLEFMQRLAALVPRPRLHLNRFHDVLAPNAKLRALVVPSNGAACWS